MSAHPADIIAQEIRAYARMEGAGRIGERAIESLTAAGYRILGPDELDPVTVERCSGAARTALIDAAHLYRGTPISSAMFKAELFATNAIRSISPESPQPEAKEARDA